MIDEIDRQLTEWVQHTLGAPVDVSLALPAVVAQGQGVSLYLLRLSDMPPARGFGRTPLQFSLHYLVTTWAEDLQAAHRLLSELAFAALESPDWEVDMAPIPAEMWLACGIAPRPSFILRVPARRERPEPETKYVLVPPEVRASPIQYIYGIVLGPGDYPLVDVRVELVNGGLSTRTDAKGSFRFPSLALKHSTEHSEPQRLRIVAKGREVTTAIPGPTSASEPLVIHFDLGKEG